MADGITKKSSSHYSKDDININQIQSLLLKVIDKQEKSREKDRAINEKRFMGLMMTFSRQIDLMGDGIDKNDPNSFISLLTQNNKYTKDMSLGFGGMRESIEALTQKLEDIETEKKVLRDKRVKQTTHKAQRVATRRIQNERDKAAPGMLLRGLIASDKAPKWLQYLSNKIGIRSFDTRKEELQERERLEVGTAQTKIDLARAKKRRELLGGKEKENLPGVMNQTIDKLSDVIKVALEAKKHFKKAGRIAKRNEIGEAIVNPFITVASNEQSEQAVERLKGLQPKINAGETALTAKETIPESTVPVTPEQNISEANTIELEKNKEKREKQIRARTSGTTEEDVVVITLSNNTKKYFEKALEKTVKDNMKSALKEVSEEEKEDTGTTEDEGAIAPEAKISEGFLSKLGKKAGKAIGSGLKALASLIPGGSIFTQGGGHAQGGPVMPSAGTGPQVIAMNPYEGITNSYDSMAVKVPSNSNFDVISKPDMKKINNNTSVKNINENAGMEAILKQLLKTNEEANKILNKIAEKDNSSEPNFSSPKISKAPPFTKSSGHEMRSIGIL